MEGADQQVRQCEHGPGERYKGRKRGEREDRDRDQGDGPDQEEDHRAEKHGGGRPFDRIAHDSTTFPVRGGLVMGRGSRRRGALASASTPAWVASREGRWPPGG